MADTNSTGELIKLVAQGVASTTKNTQTKMTKAEIKRNTFKSNTFKRRVADNTPKDAINRMTVNNKISDSAIDASPLGSTYIQDKEGSALATAPSVGVNVVARLKRLSESVEPKLQKVVAGLNRKINPISTSNVAMIAKKTRRR